MKSVQLAPRDKFEDVVAQHGIPYPVYGSYKLDGNRAAIKNHSVLSRSMKPYPNVHIQKRFGKEYDLHGLDGEFIIGEPNAPDVFKVTQAVRRKGDDCKPTLYVFDMWDHPELTFEERYKLLEHEFSHGGRFAWIPEVVLLKHVLIRNDKELEEFENEAVLLGYEGIMLRSLDGKYKYGRCTAKEWNVIKVKRFDHGEAEVIGYEELMVNQNEAYINETGHQKRSTAKEGLVPGGTLGSLICKELGTDEIFNIGSGFSKKERDHLWARIQANDGVIGDIVRFKHFPPGRVDKPRFPIFDDPEYAGFRGLEDM